MRTLFAPFFWIATVLAAAASGGCISAEPSPPPNIKSAFEAPPVVISNSATFSMTASETDRTYQIFVAWPETLAPPDGYPIIYMTDANVRFASMVDIARAWARGRNRQDDSAIIIGIGYPPGVDAGKERDWDLTPALSDMPMPSGFGGADAFMHFILDELKPEIEKRYAVNTHNQALFGHSFGGLFALHTLFHRPDAFQAYLVASPSIWWGERFLFDVLPQLAPNLEKAGAKARVLITVGELEQAANAPKPAVRANGPVLPGFSARTMVDDAREMTGTLRDMPGISADYYFFEGETHGSVPPAAMSRAVRFFFDPAEQKSD